MGSRIHPTSGLLQNSVMLFTNRMFSSHLPPMPACDFQPEPYKGPVLEHVRDVRQKNLNLGLTTLYMKPLLVHQGHMQWVWDHTGKRYLDMNGGLAVISAGHSHPKIVKALQKQSKLLWHTSSTYMHPRIHEFAEKLAAKMPGDLKVVHFVNSGSEANDLAVHLARIYTNKYDILSFQAGYHGASPHLMGLTALSTWRFQVPTGFGMHQTMNPDVYQGAWGGSNCRDSPVQTTRSCSCGEGECMACDRYLEQLENVIRYSTPKSGMAGIISEAIQGVSGHVQYPRNFIKKAYEMVRARGGVCISDEVQTGFGRTGDHFWGFEGHGVIPDIVTMAKGIGNGFPLAAVITTPEIAKPLQEALYFNTFSGDPLACAVGSTTLDVLEEEKCQQNCKTTGTYLLKELQKLRDEFDIVGDVRGKGFMVAMELVKNKETREPLPIADVVALFEATKENGLLICPGGIYFNVFMFKPPMCVTKADVDYTIAVMRKIFSEHVFDFSASTKLELPDTIKERH